MQDRLNMQTVASALGVRPPENGDALSFGNVSTDTRSLQPGDLFIALEGDSFNGHDFLEEAEQKGATAFILSQERDTRTPAILVDDTSIALGRLGAVNRLMWKGKLMAVTGSGGKTTVKEMLGHILASLDTQGDALITQANQNNQLGVPMTLLNLGEDNETAVVEIGADKPGEIGYSAALAKPNLAIITNISGAHLEGFATEQAIAKEKSMLLRSLTANGIAIVPGGDPYKEIWEEAAGSRRIVYCGENADTKIRDPRQGNEGISFTLEFQSERADIFAPILGVHNRFNIAAACIAVLLLFEGRFSLKDIAKSFKNYALPPGRLEQKKIKANGLIIDDTYNANPAAMEAAMRTLAEFTGKRICILGDMLELGAEEEAMHARLGDVFLDCNLDEIWTCGKFAGLAVERVIQLKEKNPAYRNFRKKEDLIEHACASSPENTVYLVKGSRGAKMDEVVRALLQQHGEKQ